MSSKEHEMQMRTGRRIDCRPELEQSQRGAMLSVRLARTWDEVEAAQRLRWRVFAQEMGARLTCSPGIDQDRFDDHCDHLIVLDQAGGRVVGTYRILPPAGAKRIGEMYADSEFDLTPLGHLRGAMMEIGRSCIDPVWRGSAVMAMLWGALYRYAVDRSIGTMLGCASVSLSDGGAYAADLARQLEHSWVEPALRVQPRNALPVASLARGDTVEAPTLIRGYLRAGARVGGPPAHDPVFNCADFLMLLPIDQMSERFVRRFAEPLRRRDLLIAA
jgi:putative hemolysin